MTHELRQLLYLYATGSLTSELLFNRLLDLARCQEFQNFVDDIPVDLLDEFHAWILRLGNGDHIINVKGGQIDAVEKRLIKEFQDHFQSRVELKRPK